MTGLLNRRWLKKRLDESKDCAAEGTSRADALLYEGKKWKKLN